MLGICYQIGTIPAGPGPGSFSFQPAVLCYMHDVPFPLPHK